ncbi:hypothetical protein CELD12_00280 [Cellulomonas sp. NTE-D12]|nr:hypothetical protein CELD12_00280 [Cellulomonas sp. NTE-D12]
MNRVYERRTVRLLLELTVGERHRTLGHVEGPVGRRGQTAAVPRVPVGRLSVPVGRLSAPVGRLGALAPPGARVPVQAAAL